MTISIVDESLLVIVFITLFSRNMLLSIDSQTLVLESAQLQINWPAASEHRVVPINHKINVLVDAIDLVIVVGPPSPETQHLL